MEHLSAMVADIIRLRLYMKATNSNKIGLVPDYRRWLQGHVNNDNMILLQCPCQYAEPFMSSANEDARNTAENTKKGFGRSEYTSKIYGKVLIKIRIEILKNMGHFQYALRKN